jgi:hypothetical protein
MSPATVPLAYEVWSRLDRQHAARADALTAAHRDRRAAHEKHAVDDFLYTYYSTRPAVLRRWHPGIGVLLLPGPDGPPPQARRRWYAVDDEGRTHLDLPTYLAERGSTVAFISSLLKATASRPAFTGCFGLHEWAMVYRDPDRRHPLPLRLGQRGTDEVVESHTVVCSHFDAFRFFTPAAIGRNRLQPTREAQIDLEQPGCLHGAMDCHKWSLKLGPAVPGDLALDCFALARDCRVLDMQASPYDLSALGLSPVAIETVDGKAEYVRRQRELTERAAALRSRLIEVCETLLAPVTPAAGR